MADSTVIVPGTGPIDITQTTPPVTAVALPNSTGAVEIASSSLMVPPPAGVNPFTSLTDVPNNYVGFGLWLVRVNAGATALEFVDPSGFGGGGGGISDAPSDGGYYSRRNAGWVGLGSVVTHAAGDFATAVHTHAASDVVSGTFADARIAQSSVTQFSVALFTSPALTGNPTAPTPTAADNDTSVATTAFVQTAISNVINLAPAALDTLKELADSIGDDANFAGTMTTALATKAPLASPALTGTPTVPTAAPGTNTTQAASTAFVEAARVILAAADALKAPLANPALTGTPTAPTASAGTNTTQIATTAFVTAAQALDAKLGAVNTFTKAQSVTPQALTSGGTVATDGSLSNYFTLTLGTNATLANPTNLVPGTTYLWVISQDATGLRTLAYGSLFKFPGGSVPALTATPGAVDMLSAFYDGTRLLCTLSKGYA